MYKLSMSLNDAYDFVRRKKSNISPNFNFMGQLLDFERQLNPPSPQRCTCHLPDNGKPEEHALIPFTRLSIEEVEDEEELPSSVDANNGIDSGLPSSVSMSPCSAESSKVSSPAGVHSSSSGPNGGNVKRLRTLVCRCQASLSQCHFTTPTTLQWNKLKSSSSVTKHTHTLSQKLRVVIRLCAFNSSSSSLDYTYFFISILPNYHCLPRTWFIRALYGAENVLLHGLLIFFYNTPILELLFLKEREREERMLQGRMGFACLLFSTLFDLFPTNKNNLCFLSKPIRTSLSFCLYTWFFKHTHTERYFLLGFPFWRDGQGHCRIMIFLSNLNIARLVLSILSNLFVLKPPIILSPSLPPPPPPRPPPTHHYLHYRIKWIQRRPTIFFFQVPKNNNNN